MSFARLSAPDECISKGGIAIEQEVVAEPANRCANQAVPEMSYEKLEGCAVVASCLSHAAVQAVSNMQPSHVQHFAAACTEL